MMPLALFAMAGCLAVAPQADRIEARDLIAVYPELAAAAGETALAPAPEPGYTRVFRGPELRRLAARFAVPVPPDREICFTRKTVPVDPARLLDAMQRSLPEARVELLDYSRQPAPEGPFHFDPRTLRGSPAVAIWPGWVEYAANRRFTMWAKVKLNLKMRRVVAVANLLPGRPIPAAAVTETLVDALPSGVPYLASATAAIGRWPRVAVPAGVAVRADQLEPARPVMCGQTVTVEVVAEGARLELEAQAEAAGDIGDVVAVCNPSSHKRFLARVMGPGKVSVATAPDEEAK
ncbi:MAG: flagellar basal body P-ring formation chaperone FlgA [Bryobacteraceae bacterium]